MLSLHTKGYNIMIISSKTITKLTYLINEETEYRKGYQLVDFFNDLGGNDTYGQGFPSRSCYTEEKLKSINGTPNIDKCIKNLFAPINFIKRFDVLDKCITDFNQYLAFDGWQVIRKGTEITFAKSNGVDIDAQKTTPKTDNETISDFLTQEFSDISISDLPIDGSLTTFLEVRIEEIKKCLSIKASLSVIFLSGSTLEGILLGVASKDPATYNQTKSAPKDKESGKTKPFNDWTLNNFIDASCEIGYLREDVKKFSHALRDFRNYIHPYQQMSIGFLPDENTAKICFQVLKAAISQIKQKK